MTDPASQYPSLLDELDARQNDVLHQLDALNRRIEELLKEFTAATSPEPTSKAA